MSCSPAVCECHGTRHPEALTHRRVGCGRSQLRTGLRRQFRLLPQEQGIFSKLGRKQAAICLGDGFAARAMMTAIEQAKAFGSIGKGVEKIDMRTVIVDPGSVSEALEPLRMARKVDRFRETAKMMLEPWLVEAALARLGSRRLTVEHQQAVVRATRTPWKVRWPDWWEKSLRQQVD